MPTNLYLSLLEKMNGHQYSNYFATWCPFDSHSTPAFLVFEDGMCKCLSCDQVWSHKDVNKKIGSHFQPKEVVISKVLPAWKKWEQKYDDLDGIAYHAHRNLDRFPSYQSYFKKRKIDEYIEEGYFGYIDRWILFPVFDASHKIVDIVVRSTNRHAGTRYVVSSLVASHHVLYSPSWSKVIESETIYCVYGMIDSWAMHSVGLPCVTGITGKSVNADLLRPLRKQVIIVPDDGEDKEAHRLANDLGWRARVKKIRYENDTKDPDSVRITFGKEYLLGALL